MDFQKILFRSSEVQKLEKGDHGPEIVFHPNRIIIDPKRVKSVFCQKLYRFGTAPRFLNHGNDVLIFFDEKHRQRWLESQGFSEEWIGCNLLPLQLAEVLLFPTAEETEVQTIGTERHVA